MSNQVHFIVRFTQALLAVAVTFASMLVLQFALVAG